MNKTSAIIASAIIAAILGIFAATPFVIEPAFAGGYDWCWGLHGGIANHWGDTYNC